jgi:GGDEF domain-containing protein
VLNRITEEASVRQFVDTLKANIERSPLPYKDQLIYPSLSVGFALSDGKKSREALLSEADAAMYKMKIAHRTGH